MAKNGRVYTPKETRDYERILKKEIGECPKFEGAVVINIAFLFEIPKTRRKKLTAGEYHQQKPDLDNLIKCIDAWNGVLWDDDRQVVKINAVKIWHYENGIDLEVANV